MSKKFLGAGSFKRFLDYLAGIFEEIVASLNTVDTKVSEFKQALMELVERVDAVETGVETASFQTVHKIVANVDLSPNISVWPDGVTGYVENIDNKPSSYAPGDRVKFYNRNTLVKDLIICSVTTAQSSDTNVTWVIFCFDPEELEIWKFGYNYMCNWYQRTKLSTLVGSSSSGGLTGKL